MALLLKNSDGEPDGSFTFAVVAVVCVLFKFIVGGMSLTIGTKVLSAGAVPDGGIIAAILTPTLGLYWGRRHTKASNPLLPDNTGGAQ